MSSSVEQANVREALSRPKALLFDFMGTCLDWRSSICEALETVNPIAPIRGEEATAFSMEWRGRYFAAARARTDQQLPPENIDITHRRILDRMFAERGIGLEKWDEASREKLVRRWHCQRAWPDMAPALETLGDHFDLIVHANGTTRLQIDLMRYSKLRFHAVISSELLGVSKPDPKMYLKGLELFKLRPEECMMVAAHAWDVRGAKNVGMQTAYIQRDTEDPEDMAEVAKEFDYFIDGRNGSIEAGLGELAKILLRDIRQP